MHLSSRVNSRVRREATIMAAMSEKKLREGEEHIANAEKCLKTGLFKWKPDTDGAVMEFQKAAVAFRVGKHFDKAILTYLRTADIQKEVGTWFHAGKSLEAAGMICKDQKQEEKGSDLIAKASVLYMQHGSPDTAALALERAAKIIENKNYQTAVSLYMKACDVYEAEDNARQCADMSGKAARLLIKHRMLDDAAKALKQEIEWYSQCDHSGLLYKLVMGLVLIHLHRGDSVAADQAFQACTGFDGFVESEEAPMIQAMLAAYDEGDDTTTYECLHNPLFKYMENEFTKLARDLRVPGGGGGGSRSGGAMNAGDDEDDEYSSGLL